MYFPMFFDYKNPLILSNFLRSLAFLSKETLIWNSFNTDNVSLPTQKHSKVSRGVLIERAHYYTILVEGGSYYSGGRTNRGGRSNRIFG